MRPERLLESSDPQPLIGGSVENQQRTHVDWLSFSLPWKDSFVGDVPYRTHFTESFLACAPRKGYTHAVVFKNGVRMDWHPNVPQQGVGFVYTGSVLHKLRSEGGDEVDLICELLDFGAKFTRIDIALNTALPDVSAEELRDEFELGNAETSAKSFTLVSSGGAKSGSTFYLGSRTSEQMLRVYNKAAQMGMDDVTWWRIELEMKGRHAMAFAKEVKSTFDFDLQIRSKIVSFANFSKSMWWVEALGGAEARQLQLPRTETNTQKWLQNQVLPALVKLSRDDQEVLVRFFRAAAINRGLARFMELSLLEEMAFQEWERTQGR